MFEITKTLQFHFLGIVVVDFILPTRNHIIPFISKRVDIVNYELSSTENRQKIVSYPLTDLVQVQTFMYKSPVTYLKITHGICNSTMKINSKIKCANTFVMQMIKYVFQAMVNYPN